MSFQISDAGSSIRVPIQAITLNGFINPPFEKYPIHRDIIKTLIPLGTLIWFAKDRAYGLYGLEDRKNSK